MKKIVSIIILCLVLTGCGMFKSGAQTSVLTYDVIGSVLTEFQIQAKPMCDNGTIKAVDCLELQTRYNQARTIFISAGEVLAKGIDDPNSLSIFSANMAELNKVLPVLIEIMSKYGIKIQGENK